MRQKKQKRTRMPSFAEGLKENFLNKAVGAAVVIVVILVALVLVRAFLYKSDYFRLRTVETRNMFSDQKTVYSINSQVLNLYKGRNIFNINLKSVAQSIQAAYPDAKDVVVKIILPDKLSINMIFRKPVAVVKGIKYYPIDDEGYVLPGTNLSQMKDLPVIEGVAIWLDEKNGSRNASRNLQAALALLKEIKSARFMTEYGLDRISAGDIRNLSFYMKNGIEIKIGAENFKDKLSVLEKRLKDPRLVIDRVKYIDLRFADVAIGPK